MAIVAHALIRIAGRALNTAFKKALAVTAFLALFLFAAPFALVVLEASDNFDHGRRDTAFGKLDFDLSGRTSVLVK